MSVSELPTEIFQQRQTTPTKVAAVLRDAIIRGALKAGQPLRQDELAAQFALSRIPIREALRQLEGEGLVTVYPNRGAVVSTLSGAELQELCEIRIALETTALRRALPNIDEATLHSAEQILLETDREHDVLAYWSKNNWLFHSTLYLPAGRPRLLGMIKQAHDNVDRYLRLHVSILHYKERGQSEHWAILDACKQGDTTAAVALLEEHIHAVAVLLSHYLAEPSAAGDAGMSRES